jgi:hypothetical protein
MSGKITVTLPDETARKFAEFLRSMSKSAKDDIAAIREISNDLLEGMLTMFGATSEQIEEKKGLNNDKCTEFENRINLFIKVSAAFDEAIGMAPADPAANPLNDAGAISFAIDEIEKEINKPKPPTEGGDNVQG